MPPQADEKSLSSRLEKLKKEQKNFTGLKGSSSKFTDTPYSYFHLGFEFVFNVLLFLAGGFYLDKFFSTQPLLTLAGLFLGFGIGLYRLILSTKRGQGM